MMKRIFLSVAAALLSSTLLFSQTDTATKIVVVKVRVADEAPGYDGFKAMDGDPGTMWHTVFGSGEVKHPHDIDIDLGASYEISGIEYLPRSGGSRNGTIRDFEVYVTEKGKFGEPLVKARFEREGVKSTLHFPKKVKGRFVRLRSLSEIAGRPWTSIAELRIISEGVKFVSVRADGSPVPVPSRVVDPRTELERQYATLIDDLKRRARFAKYASQTFHVESLIHDSDRDPVDIVLRRTTALLADLKESSADFDVPSLVSRLTRLRNSARDVDVDDPDARFELFKKICQLRREIALSNPLLDFDEILFVKRHRSSFNHMCDQYYGINAKPGGGLYVLSDPFGSQPEVRDVLADAVVERGLLKGKRLENGSFVSPDLSFDGKTVLFGWVACEGDRSHQFHTDATRGHWSENRSYHLFKVNIDGSGLEQLTDGSWNDFDPCWLPNGRVAFISERRGGYLRCGRVCPTYTLYDMKADGGDIQCLSPHETNEWHPSVTNDGRIIYTRWDYVDRHGCTAHLPWITTPDGRDSRAVHGNFSPRERRPDMELSIRAIPNSTRFIATAAPHHGQAYGSLVLFDPSVEDDDAMSPVKRLTPDVAFPETQGGAQVYGTAWPLSEKYYLCVYDSDMTSSMGGQGRRYLPGNYGIYLVDAFGNKELLYRDPRIACLSPMPLRPRPSPPVIPEESQRGANEPAEGTLAVINVYDSLKEWPEGTKIKALRIFQIIPMSVPSGAPPHEIGLRLPTGLDSVILARYVLGTVPVEDDGSAHFTVPARKELFFQALDEEGLAVQSMRSATYVQPGERLVCQGCHEPRNRAPAVSNQPPRALSREPSRIRPDVDGTNPFSYPRLVQPVLDKKCVSCHDKGGSPPRLDSEVIARGRKKWYASYHNLAENYGFWKYGDRHRTTPGKFGARASKLYALLQGDHHGVVLTEEEHHRINVWLDSCSIFYGVYEKEGGEAQLRGEVVKPTLE